MKTIHCVVCTLVLGLLLISCGYTIVDTSKTEDYTAISNRAFQDTVLDELSIMKISASPNGGEIVQYYAKCIE